MNRGSSQSAYSYGTSAISSILALGGLLIGGGWLLFTWQWRLLLFGILNIMVMPLGFTLLMLPVFLLSGLLLDREITKKNLVLVWLSTFIVSLWTNAALAIWGLAVTHHFVIENQVAPLLPSFLFGLGIVYLPLTYMASKEDDKGDASFGHILLVMLIYCAASGVWYFDGEFWWSISIAAVAIVAHSLISMLVVFRPQIDEQGDVNEDDGADEFN